MDNDNENNHSDSHKSFETVQCQYSDLSKAEKKKLAKKRRLEGKLQTTSEILQRLRAEYNKDSCVNDIEETDRNLKKRKLLDESEQGNSKQSCDSVSDSLDKNRSKRNKKKRRKQRKMEEKQINNIVKSLDICSISKNA